MKIHGHRGCRGLMPENSIQSFLYAIELGVDAIELDVVISGDNQVLVSHEPWLSHLYCLSPSGGKIIEHDERSYNLFKMTMDEICMADCGSLFHPDFPHQKKFKTSKPLLKDVFYAVEDFIIRHSLPQIVYNIEIKSEPSMYGIYQAFPDVFVNILCELLKGFNLEGRLILQSFDKQILKELKQKELNFDLGLLVEGVADIEKDIKTLGFIPGYYNPDYHLLNAEMIAFANQMEIKIIPWTVNEIEIMKEVSQMGVYGLITDYPNLAISNL